MYDVIVLGGGVAGTVAAIASARNNAKTLLIEKYGFCGGALTNSGVGPMMTFHAGKKQVIKGIADEIIERMKKASASVGHIMDTTGYASSVTPFDAEMLKHVLDDMLLESGCNLLYHTMLAGVNVENGRIKSVKVCNKGGLSDIEGIIFIDATGDADLSYFAGVKCKKGRDSDNLSQPMTTNLKIGNVDIDKIKKNIKDNPSNHKVKHIDMLDNTLRLSVAGFNSELENAKRNKAIEEGNMNRAILWQNRINTVIDNLRKFPSTTTLAAAKAVLNARGVDIGGARLPMITVPSDDPNIIEIAKMIEEWVKLD
jgi:ribulose 1,5-bisphosphate synthetase/thiazole synthase